MTVIFGNLQGTFEDFFLKRIDYDGFMDEMTKLVVYFVYLGVGEFVCTRPGSFKESHYALMQLVFLRRLRHTLLLLVSSVSFHSVKHRMVVMSYILTHTPRRYGRTHLGQDP